MVSIDLPVESIASKGVSFYIVDVSAPKLAGGRTPAMVLKRRVESDDCAICLSYDI